MKRNAIMWDARKSRKLVIVIGLGCAHTHTPINPCTCKRRPRTRPWKKCTKKARPHDFKYVQFKMLSNWCKIYGYDAYKWGSAVTARPIRPLGAIALPCTAQQSTEHSNHGNETFNRPHVNGSISVCKWKYFDELNGQSSDVSRSRLARLMTKQGHSAAQTMNKCTPFLFL